MNCAEVRAKMGDYLEGQLGLTDRALLDAHLDGCPVCSAEVAQMRATIGLLRSLPEPEVPGDFSANVMRRIRNGDAKPSFMDRVNAFFEDAFSPRVLAPASAALLSAGFVLWGQQVGLFEPGGDWMRPVVGDAVEVAREEVPVSVQAANGANDTGALRARERTTTAGSQLASLAPADSVPAASERDASSGPAAGPAPIVRLHIALDTTPPPYQIDQNHAAPVPAPVPFRSEWGAGHAPPQSIAVAGRNPAGLGDASSLDATLRRPAVAPTARYGVGSDEARAQPRSRDDWLAILEGNPQQFAQQLSQLTLAEQELWVDRLARHAAEQGSLDRIVERLRNAGGDFGAVLADDFAAVGTAQQQP